MGGRVPGGGAQSRGAQYFQTHFDGALRIPHAGHRIGAEHQNRRAVLRFDVRVDVRVSLPLKNQVCNFLITTLRFSVITCMMFDWVRSKPILGLMGTISAAMACVAAFGLAIYLGFEFIGINLAAPFLMIGMLSSWPAMLILASHVKVCYYYVYFP